MFDFCCEISGQADRRALLTAVFVHLSDIHFGQKKDGGTFKVNEDAKERLIDDAAAEIAKLGLKASGIILTGDIAYAGKPEQYLDAGEWLDRLTARIDCGRADIQMLPGNHDIDRDSISNSMRWMLDSIRDEGEATLNRLLDNDSDREVLFQRFEAYRDFARGYECPLDCAGDYSADGAITLAEGRVVRFVRLNSALICSRKDDEGKLILGARQRVLPICDGEEVVVLTHHPLNWFQDSADAAKYIRSRARVLISGHEHYPSLDVKEVEDGCELMLLAAGATTPDEITDVYTYKYNIIKFDWDPERDALAVTLNPRTWDDEMKRFMRDDPFLAGKDPRTVLASPNFRRAPFPVKTDVSLAEQQKTPQVEPLANPIVGGEEPVPSTPDERLLQLRFFRDMTEAERLRVLMDLGAIPDDLRQGLDHEMERLLLKRLLRKGHGEALQTRIDIAVSNRKSGDAA
jgi:hypothetical protein